MDKNEISFSFEYLTKQKKFNFDYFKHDKELKMKAKSNLVDKLIFLSEYNWKEIEQFSKKIGFEYVPKKEVKVDIPEVFHKIDKLMVFRFDEENYRMIGAKQAENNVYYIIGFDFDYEAYNHGR